MPVGLNLDTSDVKGLLGLFLAGGHLKHCRCPSKSYIRATLAAGVRDRPFLEEKVAELRQFLPTKASITPYQTPLRDSGRRTTVLRFRLSSGALRPVYNLLYPNHEREITRPVLELLGGQAAAWLWAHGCRLDAEGAQLAHVGSLRDEALLIAGWLQVLTGATAELDSGFAKPRLRLDRQQAACVQQALLPYAPRSRMHLFRPD